jgi:hypothetical protein
MDEELIEMRFEDLVDRKRERLLLAQALIDATERLIIESEVAEVYDALDLEGESNGQE